MTAVSAVKATLVLVLILLPAGPRAAAQRQVEQAAGKTPAAESTLTPDQQAALGSLRQLASELKSEPDGAAAGPLQARIADTLWDYDEFLSRSLFRSAFDSARQSLSARPAAKGDSKLEASAALRREAAAIREVLRLFSARDRKSADAWLGELETVKQEPNVPRLPERSELLAQLAVELVASHPEQAQKLGLLSLKGEDIPAAFGQLLFSLRNHDSALSDALFREALAAMRRGGYRYTPALFALTSYVFDTRGQRVDEAAPADASLLIDYYVEAVAASAAAWRDAQFAGGKTMPESASNYYSFFVSHALRLVEANAPAKLAGLRPSLEDLSAGLDPRQRQQADMLSSMQAQETRLLSGGGGGDFESRQKAIEAERDPRLRDAMQRKLALDLMREDGEKALAAADKIGDEEVRAQTGDDIRFVMLQRELSRGDYDKARLVALKLTNVNLQAQILSEISDHALTSAKDRERAGELLHEARSLIAKSDNTPDKLSALLLVGARFLPLDQTLAFVVLSDAVKTANQVKETPARATSGPPPVIRTKVFTVVNGKEMTTGERLSVEMIDFNEAGAFAESDYIQTKAVGEGLRDKLLRAKFLIAAAGSVLKSSRRQADAKRRSAIR